MKAVFVYRPCVGIPVTRPIHTMDGSETLCVGYRFIVSTAATRLTRRISDLDEDTAAMVEKKIELRRRRARGKKLAKLKDKLAAAKDGKDKDTVLAKIHRISPWWQIPAAR
jgi:hypothetical protein